MKYIEISALHTLYSNAYFIFKLINVFMKKKNMYREKIFDTYAT